MSTIGYSMAMSFVPTNGRVSPDASVETISFGKPAGSDRIAVVPMVVPAEPPREIRPWILPSSKSRRTTTAAPSAMAAMLLPRSRAASRSSSFCPAAVATSPREMSDVKAGASSTPQSITSVASPADSIRPRR